MADFPVTGTCGITAGCTGSFAYQTVTASTHAVGGQPKRSPTTTWPKILVPTWFKYQVVASDFSTAGTTNNISLFTLPAKGIIHAVKIKHSQSFTGGTISAYTISVGITGVLTKYANAFNVYQAVSGTAFQTSSTVGCESDTASTAIKVAAESTGGNLNLARRGVCDIWVLISVTA